MVNVNRGSVRPKAPRGGGGVCSSHRRWKLFKRLVNPEKNHKLFRLDSISQCQLRVGRSQGSQGWWGCVFISQEVETWEVTHRLPFVTIQDGRLWGNAKIPMLVDEEYSIEVITLAVFSFYNSALLG